jgi:hypothetical protein
MTFIGGEETPEEKLQKRNALLEAELAELRGALAQQKAQQHHTECVLLSRDLLLMKIEKSVNKLWKSVQDGMHDSRSLVGDETLNMAETLRIVGLGPLKSGIEEPE